jgi:hypothetical protein
MLLKIKFIIQQQPHHNPANDELLMFGPEI